jgi:stage II sporulation protein D
MLKKLILVLFIVFAGLKAEAEPIKVLIIDNIFQNVPGSDEKIDRMGKLRGDLLINGTHYLGNIEVWKGNSGLYLINELPLEEYVKYVVGAEVGPNWDMEALKTQAVISRTYALYQKTFRGKENYDLTSSVLHQVYKGNSVDNRISYAVLNTAGEVLVYDGKVIEALYHSTCGGKTEDAEEVFGKSYPYLRPVTSSCELSPYWIWERNIPAGEIEDALNVEGIKEILVTAYTSTKRVKTMDVLYGNSRMSVKATDLRRLLGWKRLPSTNFKVSRDNGNFVFEGKGYGHGVGLCQWSALEMAKKGMNYREILSFFYPGTTLQVYEDR